MQASLHCHSAYSLQLTQKVWLFFCILYVSRIWCPVFVSRIRRQRQVQFRTQLPWWPKLLKVAELTRIKKQLFYMHWFQPAKSAAAMAPASRDTPQREPIQPSLKMKGKKASNAPQVEIPPRHPGALP
jgi:hypothetical protein